MKLGTKVVLFVGLPFFLIVFAFIVIFAAHTLFDVFGVTRNRMRENDRRKSAEASGTITQVDKKLSGKSYGAVFTYTYDVNGVLYTESRTLGAYSQSEDSRKGMKVKICYDPSNPKDSDFYFQESFNKICGK